MLGIRKFSTIGLVVVCATLSQSAIAAGKNAATPAATTSDPALLKKTSDGKALFLEVDQRIKGDVPANAPILLSVAGLGPVAEAGVVHEFVSSGRAGVVERDDFGQELTLHDGAQPVAAGKGLAPAPSPTDTRAFPLSAQNMQVVAPSDATRWPPPDELVKLTRFDSVGKADAARYLVSGDELPAELQCIGMRVIDAGSGIVRSEAVRCGAGTEAGMVGVRDALVQASGGANGLCGRGQRVLQLPFDGGNPAFANASYLAMNETLASAGCQVMDIPPGAIAGNADSWSYISSAFEPVGPTRIKGWTPARYAVQISATAGRRTAAELRTSLAEMDPQLIDPDLALASDDTPVPVMDVAVKAVDLATGRILSQSDVLTGPDMPGDVLATVIADLVLARAPTAWLEVHPFPQSAKVSVDHAAVATVNSVGLVKLAPGSHGAELFLAGGAGKADANAGFKMRAPEYGVLAIAAPNSNLTVRTIPVGADVTVDGFSWGKSEVTKATGLGDHKVNATIEGCGSVDQTATVVLGEDNLVSIALPGTIVAHATPENATIWINGVNAGAGNVTQGGVPYGEATVTFRLAGYNDHTVKVNVDACKENPVEFRFDATLAISATPAHAQVRVDGEKIGKAPLSDIVKPGKHDVECAWCEFGSGFATPTVDPGQSVDVPVRLSGHGVRLAVGPDLGLVGHPGARLGAKGGVSGMGVVDTDLWLGGRGGVVTSEGVLFTGGLYVSAGPAARILGPGAGTSMPISARFVLLTNPGNTSTIGGMATLGLHVCAGRSMVVLFDGGLGYGAAGASGGAIGTLDFGLQWRTGAFWKAKAAASE